MSKINNNSIGNLMNLGLKILVILVLALFIAIPSQASACATYGQWHYYFGDTNEPCYGSDNNPNYYNNYNNYNGNNPIPAVYSLSPSSASTGTNGMIVTVNGVNFLPGSIARFNTANRITTYINASTLLVQLTSEDMSGLGNYLITVYNPYPGGGYSNPAYFVLNKSNMNGVMTVTIPKAFPKYISETPVLKTTAKNTAKDTYSNLAGNALWGTNGFMPNSLIQWIIFFIFILLAVILWRKIYVNDKEKHTPLKHA